MQSRRQCVIDSVVDPDPDPMCRYVFGHPGSVIICKDLDSFFLSLNADVNVHPKSYKKTSRSHPSHLNHIKEICENSQSLLLTLPCNLKHFSSCRRKRTTSANMSDVDSSSRGEW
jgi:hypothetical protein